MARLCLEAARSIATWRRSSPTSARRSPVSATTSTGSTPSSSTSRRPSGPPGGSAPRRKEHPVSDAPIRVLFVCTGNSARSQIAEAVLDAIGGPTSRCSRPAPSRRASTRYRPGPRRRRHRLVAARSKSVDEFLGQPFDYVITVCDRARPDLPGLPGPHNSLHWGLEDPAEVEGTRRRAARGLPAHLHGAHPADPAVRRDRPAGRRPRTARRRSPVEGRFRSGPPWSPRRSGRSPSSSPAAAPSPSATSGGRRRRRVRSRDHDHGLRARPRLGRALQPGGHGRLRGRSALPGRGSCPTGWPRSRARSRQRWSCG